MGSAAKKPRPMRSRRSGLKTVKLIKANLEVLKKFVVVLLVLFVAGCTPVRYVYVDPKDSVVRKQRVIHDDIYLNTPLFFNWYRPYYYNPIIIQRQRPIIVPQRPVVPQRPLYRPLPPRPPRQK